MLFIHLIKVWVQNDRGLARARIHYTQVTLSAGSGAFTLALKPSNTESTRSSTIWWYCERRIKKNDKRYSLAWLYLRCSFGKNIFLSMSAINFNILWLKIMILYSVQSQGYRLFSRSIRRIFYPRHLVVRYLIFLTISESYFVASKFHICRCKTSTHFRCYIYEKALRLMSL